MAAGLRLQGLGKRFSSPHQPKLGTIGIVATPCEQQDEASCLSPRNGYMSTSLTATNDNFAAGLSLDHTPRGWWGRVTWLTHQQLAGEESVLAAEKSRAGSSGGYTQKRAPRRSGLHKYLSKVSGFFHPLMDDLLVA